MKMLREIVLGMFVIVVIAWLVVFVYRQEDRRINRELLNKIAELSPGGGTPQTIETLRQAIALYEAQVERNMNDASQTGAFWRILAVRLADRGMHRDALEALERAIHFNSGDPFLFYMTGVSAAHVAKSIVGFSVDSEREIEHFFRLSENAYRRAIELDSTYTRPLYGLAILYVYELGRPAEAISYLERYISLQSNHIHAMFVLAAAHFLLEDFRGAIEIYERIISGTRNRQEQSEALNNINLIQRMMMYG